MTRRLPLLLLLLLAWPLPARADGRWILPRGAENAVLTWLQPLQDDAPVVADWRLVKIALDEVRLRLCVADPQNHQETCAVVQPSMGKLTLTCDAQLPPPVCARFHEVLEARPLQGSPWQETAREVPLQERPPPWWFVSARTRAGLAWLLWLGALLAFLVRLPRPWPVARSAGLAGTALLAFAARCLWSPQTFLHEGYRIDLHTEFLLTGKPWPYGEGLTAPVLLLHQLTGDGVTAMFWLNLLLGVVAVPFVIVLAGRLFAWNPGVWAGGVLVALSPLLVRWGACEEPGPLLLLMTATASVAWCHWLDRANPGRLPALLLAVASGVLTVHARPEWLPFPLLLLALPWVLRLPLPKRSWRVLIPALLLAGYAIAPLWLDRRGALQHLPNVDLLVALNVVAVWDSALTSWWYPLLALAGVAYGLRQSPRQTAWLLLCTVAMTTLALLFFATEGPYAQRMQFVQVAWTALLAGQAIGWLSSRVAVHWQVAAVGLLAVLQFALCLPGIGLQTTQQAQWQVQQDAAHRLPDHAKLVARADGSLDHFPRIALQRAHKSVELLDLTKTLASDAWPTGGDVYVWLGMACWLAPVPEAPDLATPQATCDAVRQRLVLQPVLEVQLREPPQQPHRHVAMPAGGYRIGLYRVLGRR
jgi:hypothetical protein